VPGSAFGVSESQKTVRVNCAATKENLEVAVKVLEFFLKKMAEKKNNWEKNYQEWATLLKIN
jgi:hypothetical protein